MTSLKEKQLKKHKSIATGLFLIMAIIYGLMVYLQHQNPASWMGYIEAFSEAAMVGALADWFAVTALFRYPLGIKIPHTNLIERKKNDLGNNLGSFVKENFLTAENIRPYIERLDVMSWVSQWLSKENNQKILGDEIVNLIQKIIHDLDENEVSEFLSKQGAEVLNSINFQNITSKGIQYLIEKNEHIRLLETLLPQIKEYVKESQQLIRERISENRPFISFLAGKRVSRELTDGFLAFIEEIESDEEHFVRKKLSENLKEFSEEFSGSKKWKSKIEELKNQLILPEKLKPYANDAWSSVRSNLNNSLNDPNSSLRKYLNINIEKLAYNLENDENMSIRINHWIRRFLYRMILKNSGEVQRLIGDTVSRWEGKELSQKLELEVGKDLQFIRINGTLVGGIVGLIIYCLTQIFV